MAIAVLTTSTLDASDLLLLSAESGAVTRQAALPAFKAAAFGRGGRHIFGLVADLEGGAMLTSFDRASLEPIAAQRIPAAHIQDLLVATPGPRRVGLLGISGAGQVLAVTVGRPAMGCSSSQIDIYEAPQISPVGRIPVGEIPPGSALLPRPGGFVFSRPSSIFGAGHVLLADSVDRMAVVEDFCFAGNVAAVTATEDGFLVACSTGELYALGSQPPMLLSETAFPTGVTSMAIDDDASYLFAVAGGAASSRAAATHVLDLATLELVASSVVEPDARLLHGLPNGALLAEAGALRAIDSALTQRWRHEGVGMPWCVEIVDDPVRL